MLNKKLGLFVLAAAAMGLASCGGNSGTSSSAKSSDPGTSSTASHTGGLDTLPPVAEGKVTVYFEFAKLGEEYLDEIPSYCSPFITGGFADWKTSMDGETKPYEMIKLANTNYYYAQIPADKIPTGSEAADVGGRGFQITLGWNESSNAPASQQGVDWAYKSSLSALYPGSSHPKMDAPDANNRIKIMSAEGVVADPLFPDENSDDHWMNDPESPVAKIGFTSAKAAPVPIARYVQPLQFGADAWNKIKDSNLEFHIAGGFNGWNSTWGEDNKLTFDANGRSQIVVENVYSGVKIEFQVCAKIDDTNFWADANKTRSDNYSFTPLSADEGEAEDPVMLEWAHEAN